MNFSFLILSFLFCLSFFLPPNLNKPVKQGLFLFSAILFLISIKFPSFLETKSIINRIDAKRIVRVCVGLVILSFLYHGYFLSDKLANSFQFHDADYIGIQEVIRNLFREGNYHSTYYSLSGNDSYLTHHFAPSLFFFIPFELLFPHRWGYAAGVYFYSVLGIIIWTEMILSSISEENSPNKSSIGYLIIFAILSNLYLYRLGTSYHFEVLVYPLSALFFYFFNQEKLSIGLIVSLLCFVWIKEDIVIYLLLFLGPLCLRQTFKSPLYILDIKVLSDLRNRLKTNFTFKIILLCLCYLVFSFLVLPQLVNIQSERWFGSLSGSYSPDYKQVTSISKSIQIFFELCVSFGSGSLLLFSHFWGVFLIYLTHFFSNRPWHHEVYAYYCYTIVPFLLASAYLWMKEKKDISNPLFYFLLSLLLYRNVLDSNFPISLARIENEGMEKKMSQEVREELRQMENNKILNPISNIFVQYNLSFFMPKSATLYPLDKIDLIHSKCVEKDCYLVIAPNFTNERLVSKETIENKITKVPGWKLKYKGTWIQIWNSN